MNLAVENCDIRKSVKTLIVFDISLLACFRFFEMSSGYSSQTSSMSTVCPSCLCFERYKDSFELEWHVLRAHGTQTFISLLKSDSSQNSSKYIAFLLSDFITNLSSSKLIEIQLVAE